MERERTRTMRENFSPAHLCALIKERHTVQRRLVEYLGVSEQSFCQWKRGTRIPLWKHVRKLAEYYGVPCSYFFDDWDAADDQQIADYLGLSKETVQMLAALREHPECAGSLRRTMESFVKLLAAATGTEVKI